MMSSSIVNYFQLKNYTAITVKGSNAKELLQGQASCDFNEERDYYDAIFCDEKGYVITNSAIFVDDGYLIVVRDEVGLTLMNELKKFSKFFDCVIESNKIPIYGEEKNGKLKKLIGNKNCNLDSEDWDIACMLNLSFDINEKMSGIYRVNELGYCLDKYISYEKGCYRGQEIIARLTYLGKKTKKVVVFDRNYQEIRNSENKIIGKKIYSLTSKNKDYSHFFVEDTNYFSEGKRIIPVTNQWDQDPNL